jgi:hypothetical protein
MSMFFVIILYFIQTYKASDDYIIVSCCAFRGCCFAYNGVRELDKR